MKVVIVLLPIVVLLLLPHVANYLTRIPDPAIPYKYHWKTMDNIWTEEELDQLVEMTEGLGSIPSATRDQTYKIEDIGEAEPIINGTFCANKFLVPNGSNTKCVLPGRFDVARHYLTFGGKAGIKEQYEDLVSRMLSFNKFFFDFDESLKNIPALKSLFNAKDYLGNSKLVCDLGKDVENPVLDPFQLGIIVQVPGQSVPMHLDAPYFWGAGRYSLPIWLLIVMQFSGLWEDKRIHQVQGVAYIHKWPEAQVKENGGGFFFYPGDLNGESITIPAKRNTGIVCDGGIQVHGTELFKPKTENIIPLSREHENNLVFDKKTREWSAIEDNKKVLGKFQTNELRIALVWRARCFKTERERESFNEQHLDISKQFDVETVLNKLIDDLVKRGRIPNKESAGKGLDLAMLLLKEYLRYPRPDDNNMINKYIPWNWCALPALHEWTRPLIDLLCPRRA